MIFVLLPAYNEEDSIEPLMGKLVDALSDEPEGYRIVVCNDGSWDQTAVKLEQWAKDYPIHILHHKVNRGLGETCRDLFEYAAEHTKPGDTIIRMDCDDTHDPNVMKSMKAKLADGYDVVIASRFQPGGGQQGLDGYRTFISQCANLFMKTFFPIKGIREYSCGFRAYRAEIIKQAISLYGNDFIQLKGLGFTCTLEKLVKLKLLGARFGEVPFELRYDRKMSGSKMVSSITTLGYIVLTILYHWPFGGWRVQAPTRQPKPRPAISGTVGDTDTSTQ